MLAKSYNFTERETYYRGLTDTELEYALKDARATLAVSMGGPDEGYRFDDCSTIHSEMRRRLANRYRRGEVGSAL